MSKWPGPTAHSKPPDDDTHSIASSKMYSGLLKAPSRPHTPLSSRLRSLAGGSQSGQAAEPEPAVDEDPQIARFRQLYEQSEARIASLFDSHGHVVQTKRKVPEPENQQIPDVVADAPPIPPPTSKKRKLDDDYDDYDDDEDEDTESASPLKEKSNKVQIIADATTSSPVARPVANSRGSSDSGRIAPKSQPSQKEDAEDARKKLEAAKRAEIETVKTMSRTMFFTLESDRDAMLDQQRLDEAERRAEAEAEGHANRQNAAAQQGSLSSANLGASSLTLKNLIAQIDNHRVKVHATDQEVRALLSEVRKNRSKWASEDKVGQEELYEAAEKVLNELKAMTEHSTPFLNPVKKKDAPDYYNIIKVPMDLGTMTKKLKNLAYKSKKEFVDDLYQIWKNCLKFNSSPDHLFRKHALFMQKETDKLAPLIPEIVIRDRAEIEAEERRQQIANGEIDDGAEESDDEPIMASRGRKAPKKSAKKGTSTARKSVPETTPLPETKPVVTAIASVQNGIRAESEMDGGSQGHSTPPPGVLTPVGAGHGSVLGAGSEAPEADLPSLPPAVPPVPEYEDEEYRLWKQKTKKDRAMLATARHRLFRGDKLNAEEDALLRTKAAMRRWQRMQQEAGKIDAAQEIDESRNKASTSLSEGLEAEEETLLPDYYNSMSAIPDLDPRLRWEKDSMGQVLDQSEEYLRLFPADQFKSPNSAFAKKINANLAQMQETRKIVSKIGVVKQMQIQSQTYQNQFAKYQPEPVIEQDIEKHVMSDEGPIMAPYVCKAALQRSVGKIFLNAGFEEFQPSALDAVTDMAQDFFRRMCSTLIHYKNEQHVPIVTAQKQSFPLNQRPSMTNEEIILHTLTENGHTLNDLDSYVREETDRLSTKLQTMHERMKAHLADLLRPALTEDTAQGHGNFADGGEQYVGGDFAEDLGEDFFGFKELGLMKELGLDTLTVPFHILHGRLNMAANQNQTAAVDGEKIFKDPPRWPKVNVENVDDIIGVGKNFFRKRLTENGDRPLLEDYELPPKQRPGYGRARVPASGKIGGDAKSGASPMKKVPVNKGTGTKQGDVKGKGASGEGVEKGKGSKDVGKANGVLVDEAEPVPMMNGVKSAGVSNGTGLGVTVSADGSPEKKKKKSSTVVIADGDVNGGKNDGAAADNGDSNGAVKINGEGSMMSPESL